MKILLVETKHPYVTSSYSYPRGAVPYALVCVATYLREKGKDVEILDMNAEDMDYDKLPEVLEEKKPDVVGVPSACTMYIPDSFRVCKIAKEVNSGIVTVGGGINFTAATEFYMRMCPELDFVVRGDGEHTMLRLVEALERGERDFSKIPGLAWRDGEEIHVGPEYYIDDLDSLPHPNWDLVDLDKYGLGIFPPSWGKQVMFTLARGCPYRCNFCVATRGQGRYRCPSVDWSLEAIRILRRKYDRRMLYINDLCFGVSRDWTEELCKRIIEEKLDVNMCVDMRTDLVVKHKDLLPLMRKAGVRIVCLGVESPLEEDEPKYQKKAGGKSPAGMAEEAVKYVKRAGIELWTFNMVGAPWHTPRDIKKILDFADKLDGEVTIFSIFTPLPGTPLYEEMKERGLILTDDLTYFSETEPITKNFYMTPEELFVLYAELWVAFYAKPLRILKGLLSSEDTFRGWFYRKLYGRSKAFGKRIRSARERGHWPISPEEERRLQKWAKRVLGSNRFEMLLQDLAFQFFFKVLGKGKAA